MSITREELEDYLSKGTFWDMVKDLAVDFHMSDDRVKQMNANDLMGFDVTSSSFFTHTGIRIALNDVNYLDVY